MYSLICEKKIKIHAKLYHLHGNKNCFFSDLKNTLNLS